MTIGSHKETQAKSHNRQEEEKKSRSQRNQLLRQARQKRCWSQAELAEQVGVSNETVSRWENGVSKPQPYQLKKLCEVFDKTPEELGYLQGEQESIRTEEAPEASGYPLELVSIEKTTPSSPPPAWRRSRVIIRVITGLIVALLIFGVVDRFVFPANSGATNCAGAFFDGFDGKLDSRWNWINPGGNATHYLTKTGISLSTPTGSDLNPARNFNAPRLLLPITGNFTIETRLVFRPNTNFQSAGILLWQSPTTFIRFERGFGGPKNLQKSGVLFQEWDHGTTGISISGFAQNLTTSGSVELRIQRQGDNFIASWRVPGQIWQTGGSTTLHFDSFDKLMAGVDLLDVFNALQNTTVTYRYFRVSCT